MFVTKRFKAGRSAAALLFVAVLAVSAFAEIPSAVGQRKVADQLADFKTTAFGLRSQADTLQSPSNRRLSWQSHSYSLVNIADHVNQKGRSLAELEAMKPMANESQKVAIEQARMHLVLVAENATRALDLVKENRSSIQFPAYGEAVDALHLHARELHTKLDTILDFENARLRLESLDLSREAEGS